MGETLIVAQTDEIEKIDEAIRTATGWDIAAAVLILLLALPVASLIGRLARRIARRIPGTPEYVPELIARAFRWLVMVVAFAWAVSLLGVDVGWFALVVASVLVIFILMVRPLVENLAAGLLLQSRDSFGVGDQIETNGYRGDVVEITARSTVIRTRDWKRIHVPNQDVLANPLDVFTAFERRRSAIDLEIDYAVDPDHAEEVLVNAVRKVEGVLDDPEPYVLARGIGENAGTMMQVRWWHQPDLRSQSRTLDRVLRAIRRALDDAGIDPATLLTAARKSLRNASPELRLIGDSSVAKRHEDEER